MTSVVLMDSAAQQRRRFVRAVAGVGGDVRALYLPSMNEGLVAPDAAVAGMNWTHATPIGNRLSRLGKGAALTLNGTTDYLSTPDRASLSFGNGTTDTAFNIFALLNVTDTAAPRAVVGKDDAAGAGREWRLTVNATDQGILLLSDQSVPAVPFRTTDAAVVQGSWRSLGISYTGAGGAAAMDGVAFYQNGLVIASTTTNDLAYVAMEDLNIATMIGASLTAGVPSAFFAGQIAMVMVWAGAAGAAKQGSLTQLARSFFGVL